MPTERLRSRRIHPPPIGVGRPPMRDLRVTGELATEIHTSATALVADAMRRGVSDRARPRHASGMPRGADTIRVGDPDDNAMANEYVGDETPGGSASTPDQSNVDDIGRAYGLQEEDTGALQSAGEVLARRDRHRQELNPPRKKHR
jgi:hypothetical protein